MDIAVGISIVLCFNMTVTCDMHLFSTFRDYLLSVRGLGLKSVECVRLLTLHHLAFPVCFLSSYTKKKKRRKNILLVTCILTATNFFSFALPKVDTNVGRICVRLGWVPLQPLPESLQLHLLEL